MRWDPLSQRGEPGQRVGVGWHGGHCGQCDACRRGDFILCRSGQVCGISYDGGGRNMWWCRGKRWLPCRMNSRLKGRSTALRRHYHV